MHGANKNRLASFIARLASFIARLAQLARVYTGSVSSLEYETLKQDEMDTEALCTEGALDQICTKLNQG